jgi:hypothetical protein
MLKLNEFINTIFGSNDSEEQSEEEPDPYKLKKYISNLEIETDVAKLVGPFLLERYALAHYESFKDVLHRTYSRVNLTIVRYFTLICTDKTFETRDNSRVELGINPFSHRIELSIVKEKSDFYFDVKGVDGFILMNTDDIEKVRDLVVRFPPTLQELRTVIVK